MDDVCVIVPVYNEARTVATTVSDLLQTFDHVVCIASAARVGEPAMWADRAALVRRAGTPVMVGPSVERWFSGGFVEREPAVANRLLLSLSDTDKESYALAWVAQQFDVPIRILRAVSDRAQDGATELWDDVVERCSHELRAKIRELYGV